MAYQKWEEKAHPNFLSEDVVQKEYKEFDREYLNILSRTMNNLTSDDIIRQIELCKKYQDVQLSSCKRSDISFDMCKKL